MLRQLQGKIASFKVGITLNPNIYQHIAALAKFAQNENNLKCGELRFFFTNFGLLACLERKVLAACANNGGDVYISSHMVEAQAKACLKFLKRSALVQPGFLI